MADSGMDGLERDKMTKEAMSDLLSRFAEEGAIQEHPFSNRFQESDESRKERENKAIKELDDKFLR